MALPKFAFLVLVIRAVAAGEADEPARSRSLVEAAESFGAPKSDRHPADGATARGLNSTGDSYSTRSAWQLPSSDAIASPPTTVDQRLSVDEAASGRRGRVGNATGVEGRAEDDDYADDDEKHDGGGHGGHGHGGGGGGHKKKKKKKKKHHGFLSFVKKMKKHMPAIMKKMHGPSMFMMGMAHANFHNFVMHALMMSKMALTTVVMMIIREMVFGDKDQPVKYYNFGYDHHAYHRRNYDTPYDYPYEYKRRRR